MLVILTSRRFTVDLKCGLDIRYVDLFRCAKTLGTPLYTRSYFRTGRILTLPLLDKVIGLTIGRLGGRPMIIVPDPKGQVLDQKMVMDIVRSYRSGQDIVILNPSLSGYDDRIRKMYNISMISLGNYVVSTGRHLIRIIADCIDRSMGLRKGRGWELDSTMMLGSPGSKNFGPPASYKGLVVPDNYVSGNEVNFQNTRFQEVILWTMRNDFLNFLRIVYEFVCGQ